MTAALPPIKAVAQGCALEDFFRLDWLASANNLAGGNGIPKTLIAKASPTGPVLTSG